MELFIFGRFHARPGQADAVGAAISQVTPPTRAEAGCLAMEGYRSTQDPDLFWIHSRWIDEAAFETHAALAHTVTFLATVAPLVDHPLQISRSYPLAP
jgi:quinol monooxygenase YgiN